MFTNNTQLLPLSEEKSIQYRFLETKHIIDRYDMRSCFEHSFNLSFVNFVVNFSQTFQRYSNMKLLKNIKLQGYGNIFTLKNIKYEVLALTEKFISINVTYRCSKNRFNQINERFSFNNNTALIDYDTLFINCKQFF